MGFSIGRVLSNLPRVIELVETAGKAATGDPDAQKYLREDAGYDALDIFMHRGAGGAARGVVEGAKMLLNPDGTEASESGPVPWSGFVTRLFAQKSGGFILLGSMGTGKTQLAIALAHRWYQRGYHAEFCSMYPSDVPTTFGNVIHIDTLVKRMKGLSAHLKAQAVRDDDEGELEEDRPGKKVPPKMPPGHRVIVIDEAGLTLTTSAQDPARRAALQYVAQSRHCDSHVLFLGQAATQIPLPLLGQCCIFIKRPVGDEADTDRDNPVVRALWGRAAEAFKGLTRSPYYVAPYNDVRSWAYVHAPGLNYRGLVPWTPYPPQEVNDAKSSH